MFQRCVKPVARQTIFPQTKREEGLTSTRARTRGRATRAARLNVEDGRSRSEDVRHPTSAQAERPGSVEGRVFAQIAGLQRQQVSDEAGPHIPLDLFA
jgi:hypothetical protein